MIGMRSCRSHNNYNQIYIKTYCVMLAAMWCDVDGLVNTINEHKFFLCNIKFEINMHYVEFYCKY